MYGRTFAVAAIAALLAGLTGGPAQAEGGDVTWTVRTASNSYGADRSSFSYAVNPGGTLDDSMIVANRGQTPLTLGVYTADGFTTDAGQLDLKGKTDKPLGVGRWVHSPTTAVTVPAGKTVTVPFKVTVPQNATPGDYVGGIVTSLTQPDQSAGINVERRLGIRIKLRIGGELKPALTISGLHVTYHGGNATVGYTINNTGNATMSARQAVTLAGPFGMFRVSAAKVGAPPELLPGESWKVSTTVDDVTPAIRLAATATVTPLLTDASGSTNALPAVVATGHTWALPWLPLIAFVALIALVVVAVLLTRRNRKRRKEREDARVREAVDQALRESQPAA